MQNAANPVAVPGCQVVVMGNLTITPERQKLVDFNPLLHSNVDEFVITGPAAQKSSHQIAVSKNGFTDANALHKII